MDSVSRHRLALRILRDEAVLEDLYDHFLIHEAEKEGIAPRGRNILKRDTIKNTRRANER